MKTEKKRPLLQRIMWKQSVSLKASLLLVLVGTVVLMGTSFFVQSYNNQTLYQKISDVSISNLKSIHGTMQTIIDNINTYSYLFLSNSSLQNALAAHSESAGEDDTFDGNVLNILYDMIGNMDTIEAVYVYDKQMYRYGVDKASGNLLQRYRVTEYEWYDEVTKRRGGYYLDYHNSDFYLNQQISLALCFVREIRNLSTMQPIGYMILTVSQNALEERLQLDRDYGDMDFYIFTDDQKTLVDTTPKNYQKELKNLYRKMTVEGKNSATLSFDGVDYFISLYQEDGLNYMNMTSFDGVKADNQMNALITLILLMIQVVLIVVGGIFISNWFTRPMRRLMESMEKIKSGIFEPVQIRLDYYEIQALVDDYNQMIEEIQNLLAQTKKIERQKRKADLEVLNMQINPHFLYNTFDSIKSLLLLRRYDDAYQMMTSLSKFYKINLSKGDESITIKQEIEMIRQYLVIQKMRYGETIDAKFEIDSTVQDCRILKLVLQPLVENSIYHGIREGTEQGLITIRVISESAEKLKIEIMDNGLGMTERTLQRVLNGEGEGTGKSFGLRGTLKRLEYFYGERVSYTVKSQINKGTCITIWIPAER